jgi:hypothetical protein
LQFFLVEYCCPAERDKTIVLGLGIAKGRMIMNSENFEDKLNELVKEFGWLAAPQPVKAAKGNRRESRSSGAAERGADSLQDSLDFLRICIKYQRFDLEATRRENKYLKELLSREND